MATFRVFEEIDAWKIARSLTREVYELTRQPHVERDFAFCNQVRRASISVMANIAEGFERGGNREFIQFLSLAKGSAGEVRSLMYIALDQEYITPPEFDRLNEQCQATCRRIHGLMEYLSASDLKGAKYSAAPASKPVSRSPTS